MTGQLIVVSGPSGSGKSTVLRRVLACAGERVRLSVSATTRKPRPGERHEVDYYFYENNQFTDMIKRGEFLEFVEYNSNRYGTPVKPVHDALASGVCVILEIDVKGAMTVREHAPDALFVFIRPPTFAVLEKRLRNRGTDDDLTIMRRLRIARTELDEAHRYDVQLINDDLDRCVEDFLALLQAYGCGG